MSPHTSKNLNHKAYLSIQLEIKNNNKIILISKLGNLNLHKPIVKEERMKAFRKYVQVNKNESTT